MSCSQYFLSSALGRDKAAELFLLLFYAFDHVPPKMDLMPRYGTQDQEGQTLKLTASSKALGCAGVV